MSALQGRIGFEHADRPGREHILGLSDEALAEYALSGTHVYDSEAIEFARQEFARRNLDPSRIGRIEEAALHRIAASEEIALATTSRPLDFWDKVCAFLWPLPFETFMHWVKDDIRGESRRASQRLQYGCLGAIFYIVVFALLAWLSR